VKKQQPPELVGTVGAITGAIIGAIAKKKFIIAVAKKSS